MKCIHASNERTHITCMSLVRPSSLHALISLKLRLHLVHSWCNNNASFSPSGAAFELYGIAYCTRWRGEGGGRVQRELLSPSRALSRIYCMHFGETHFTHFSVFTTLSRSLPHQYIYIYLKKSVLILFPPPLPHSHYGYINNLSRKHIAAQRNGRAMTPTSTRRHCGANICIFHICTLWLLRCCGDAENQSDRRHSTQSNRALLWHICSCLDAEARSVWGCDMTLTCE